MDIFLQETYVIEDCLVYDNALYDKSSQYTVIDAPSFTYNNNGYYVLKKQGGSGFGFVTPYNTSITTNDNISITMTIESVGMFGGIGLYKTNSVYLPLIYYTSEAKIGMYGYGSTNAWIIPMEVITSNVPLKLKYELNNGLINCYVYKNNTLVWSKTNISIPSVFNNSDLKLVVCDPSHSSSSNYVNFKDILIKPL